MDSMDSMKFLPSMLLQVTRNPEHLSMSRDSNCTKQNGLPRTVSPKVGELRANSEKLSSRFAAGADVTGRRTHPAPTFWFDLALQPNPDLGSDSVQASASSNDVMGSRVFWSRFSTIECDGEILVNPQPFC